ncbi:vicilin-like seed storage protein At2g18540 [Amborella trichopoda]|uniref:vicilin-like seed storage protein At2g18540 n=1 Tax=Amborella trichopoda TaxID=13333 RepID=UPI0005D32559|nr:vicilin-like seed storage protein At2g18540 [Amborella trichopoda]|eukprot:XP_011627755.1 vicilin-like seed storage protein At2g18540 [Amborella trichopoda]
MHSTFSLLSSLVVCLLLALPTDGYDPLITRDNRKPIVSTEFGRVESVEVYDGSEKEPLNLQFFTLEPSSLLLPLLVEADMVFFVQTGSGRVSWVEKGDITHMDIARGDVYRLRSGSVFYVQSKTTATGEKLRLNALFTRRDYEDTLDEFIGTYANLSDVVLGFDNKVLQASFKISEELIKEIKSRKKPQMIVPAVLKEKTEEDSNWKLGILEALVGGGSHEERSNKKRKPFNVYKKEPDFKNPNGWTLTVTRKDFPPLKGTNVGVFMVNLTKGSMVGPHWNPRATEIAIVTHGQGMVNIVCPSKKSQCPRTSFKVKEGDIFMVPKFHPMSQMSFSNESLSFMGFTTMAKKNHPQFIAGKLSVLNTLDPDIVAEALNLPKSSVQELLSCQRDAIILPCTYCAEEEERAMEEEVRKREEEEREAAAAAARKREEERKERERREEARRREEEEVRERERQEEEEARQREEEAARERERQEEEEAKQKEEEAVRERERQEEEGRQREDEEARQREREKEDARKREEEAARERERQEEEVRQTEEEQRERAAMREEEGGRPHMILRSF